MKHALLILILSSCSIQASEPVPWAVDLDLQNTWIAEDVFTLTEEEAREAEVPDDFGSWYY